MTELARVQPPFGHFELEVVVKPDGRRLHLYTWADRADRGTPDRTPEPPAGGGEPAAGPDAEEQPGV